MRNATQLQLPQECNPNIHLDFFYSLKLQRWEFHRNSFVPIQETLCLL